MTVVDPPDGAADRSTGPARVRVKICCIMSAEESALAVAAGADALGLVSEMPSGPGVIDEAEIAAIVAAVPPPVATFLLTSRLTAREIVAQHERCRTSALQLVDTLPAEELVALRRALPGIRLVQVIHVTGPEALVEARRVAPLVDLLLLDSGRPGEAVKVLGGTGRVHDWSVSRRIRGEIDRPLFLAGGLNPENVADALKRVEPFGLDVCSGVRTAGRLDPVKLDRFMAAVRAGARSDRSRPEGGNS